MSIERTVTLYSLASLLHFTFSLRDEITDFADNLIDWLDESLTNVPQSLKEAKLEGMLTSYN